MQLNEFDYELPADRIAQQPLVERDASRLLRLDRASGALEDHYFRELPELLQPGDLLVANASRVIPARLLGSISAGEERKPVEVLLLRPVGDHEWEALAKPARRLPVGAHAWFAPGFEAEVVGTGERGVRRLRFTAEGELATLIERHGHMPLPPYIHRPDEVADRERYQTVYAAQPGSAAAPTAGLHFTPAVLAALSARGVAWTTITLHVGLGTFQPVSHERIEDHPMHREQFEVPGETAAALNRARREGRRIIAVGTTAARVLETLAASGGDFAPTHGETGIYIYPGKQFRALNGLLTNFHAPRTTLLMMIAAFAGLDPVRHAYQHALASGYRFLSYGDCMLIL